LAERAPQRRRGFFAGFSSAGLIIGMLLGSIVGILVNWSMPLEAVAAWGWRVPFLAGFLIGGVALVLRLTIAETGMPVPPSRAPVAEAISQYGAKILIATAGIMALAANWYTAVIYLPTWMVAQLGLERSLSLEINILSLGLAMIAGLVGAIVSDRVGRRPMLIAAALALAVFTFPLYLLLGRGNVISVAVAQACLMAICGCYTFALPTALAEMFPWRVRVSAASLSFNLAFAIFGGTAPVIATWLVAETAGLLPVAVYLSLLGALSAVAWLGVSLPFSGDLSRPGDCYDRRSVN
jgi:MHS family proline/betaine transporter-like MFS transporter